MFFLHDTYFNKENVFVTDVASAKILQTHTVVYIRTIIKSCLKLEKLEYTKGVTRSRKSKRGKQCNSQKKKNNTTKHYTED